MLIIAAHADFVVCTSAAALTLVGVSEGCQSSLGWVFSQSKLPWTPKLCSSPEAPHPPLGGFLESRSGFKPIGPHA